MERPALARCASYGVGCSIRATVNQLLHSVNHYRCPAPPGNAPSAQPVQQVGLAVGDAVPVSARGLVPPFGDDEPLVGLESPAKQALEAEKGSNRASRRRSRAEDQIGRASC